VIPAVDVLIPTYRRAGALAVTLGGVAGQTYPALRVIVSDQTEADELSSNGPLQAVLRVLQARGIAVELHRHLPRRGLAEHRQFLLDRARAPYVLSLDDDLILEPGVIARLVRVIREQGCGFVGAAFIGLSHVEDERPHEQAVELWNGPVRPETVMPGSPSWERYRLHNAANLYHVERRLGASDEHPLRYKVAWTAGCALFDTEVLRSVGGYTFWRDLPAEHVGEDVLVQLRVMAAAGGCGVMPSGVYHQELPTTVPNRAVDAPQVLPL
jgi:GT2 family glycosyltransferase